MRTIIVIFFIIIVLFLILIETNSCNIVERKKTGKYKAEIDTALIIIDWVKSGDRILAVELGEAEIITINEADTLIARPRIHLSFSGIIDTLDQSEFDSLWFEKVWGVKK